MDGTIAWMINGGERDLPREERLQRWHRRALDDARLRDERGARGPRLAMPAWFAGRRGAPDPDLTLDCCAA
jgi:hypothetical protein